MSSQDPGDHIEQKERSKEDETSSENFENSTSRKKKIPCRICPGLVWDGKPVKCGRAQSQLILDPHPICQKCVGSNCDLGVCVYCKDWSDEVRAIFRARKNLKKAYRLLSELKNTGDPNIDQSNVSLNESIESSSVNTASLLSNLDIKHREASEGSTGKATANITKVEKHNPPVVPLGEGHSLKGNVPQSSSLVQTPHNITASPFQLSNNLLLQMGQMLATFGGMGGTQGGMQATNPLFQVPQSLPSNPVIQNQWNPFYAAPYLPQGYIPRGEQHHFLLILYQTLLIRLMYLLILYSLINNIRTYISVRKTR